MANRKAERQEKGPSEDSGGALTMFDICALRNCPAGAGSFYIWKWITARYFKGELPAPPHSPVNCLALASRVSAPWPLMLSSIEMNIPLQVQPQHTRSGISPACSPAHSPKTSPRRSLTIDDNEYPYAYDFPQYTYVPSPASSVSPLPSTNPIPVPPAFSHKSPARHSGSQQSNNTQGQSHSRSRDTMATAATAAPTHPPSSARFVHSSYPSLNTSVYPSSSTTTPNSSSPNRARGPSFASTTSYASSSTASSSSSAAPATPPRANHMNSPTVVTSPTRTFRPYWERERVADEDSCRLDEAAEHGLPHAVDDEEDSSDDEVIYGFDERRNSTASADFTRYISCISPSPLSNASRKPRSVRRSPFADDNPASPYTHVYLDDDLPHPYGSLSVTARAASPAAVASRRLSGSGSIKRRSVGTDSPRSVARSVSLSHSNSYRRSSPHRAHSPIINVSGSSSRPHSPSPMAPSLVLYSHSSSNSQNTHSHANLNEPVNSHLHSHSPSLDLPDQSIELDSSPLRTALLLNPEPDLTITRTSTLEQQLQHQEAAERRLSAGGVGRTHTNGTSDLGLGGLGLGSGFGLVGGINAALQRRRADWREFNEGDDDDAPTNAFGRGALNLHLDADEEVDVGGVDLSSPRPSFSHPHPYGRVSSSVVRSRVGADEEREEVSKEEECREKEGNESNGAEERREEGDEVPTCSAFRWSVRARWAALKLKVRLSAFRARKRVGLA
ncbi:uncharacterized protein FOMMEDRAFT_168949 [Fomitiporia mediterranea MF3/22]|uniref:uncharacterized protein n=1 Tax=Fomitiporia mediterranea (strain MF3/22) TaxID=694068 RepID=UPI0004409BBF|nr:uncharacterized protein FOMMEDRAFT_168949 [Fomitiporia mediterranea MF3/22]EJD02505.1 hypothetical protein FOMMEDRAFT_168949 [Fomitiporia mediterranea MF3/22]